MLAIELDRCTELERMTLQSADEHQVTSVRLAAVSVAAAAAEEVAGPHSLTLPSRLRVV